MSRKNAVFYLVGIFSLMRIFTQILTSMVLILQKSSDNRVISIDSMFSFYN